MDNHKLIQTCCVALVVVVTNCWCYRVGGQDAIRPQPEIAPYAEGVLRLELMSSALNNMQGYSKVASELELVPQQKQEIMPALSEFNSEYTKSVAQLSQAAVAAHAAKDSDSLKAAKEQHEKEMADLVSAAEKKVESVLLPHQTKRLGQISFQMVISRTHQTFGIGMLLPIVEKLDIPTSDKEAFREDVKALDKDFQMELKALREKYAKAAFKLAPKTIKKELEERIGDLVYFDR